MVASVRPERIERGPGSQAMGAARADEFIRGIRRYVDE
jgi:hypothetical protein